MSARPSYLVRFFSLQRMRGDRRIHSPLERLLPPTGIELTLFWNSASNYLNYRCYFILLNPFIANASFLYSLKTLENLIVYGGKYSNQVYIIYMVFLCRLVFMLLPLSLVNSLENVCDEILFYKPTFYYRMDLSPFFRKALRQNTSIQLLCTIIATLSSDSHIRCNDCV